MTPPLTRDTDPEAHDFPTGIVTAVRHGPAPAEDGWAATMLGHPVGGSSRAAHPGAAELGAGPIRDRRAREASDELLLAPGATRALGAGRRGRPEAPDPYRTCFERDRDRIVHSSAFRRLAGKTQVFIFPADHQRTRLTHALEVAQVATAIARACGANVALTEAIALGHDCGHGPGGHASEQALSPFLADGFDHAVWGAEVVLGGLNLCEETLDGIRNHSWSRPAPSTPEGEIVSWADRIAYVCHDFEDAVSAGLVRPQDLPRTVAERCGVSRGAQIASFVDGVLEGIRETGAIAMDDGHAEALAVFRAFNHERIYLRPASVAQAEAVIAMLRALVEHLATAEGRQGTTDDYRSVVTYVAGMTDRFACRQAVEQLDWPLDELPRGIDLCG